MLTLRLWAETGRTGDGTTAVLRSLKNEQPDDLRIRLQSMINPVYKIHQKMHQFPVLDLFYRSKDPMYPPEFMIRSAVQMSITSQILSADEKYNRLKPVAKELEEVATEVVKLIAAQHMSKELLNKLLNSHHETVEDYHLNNIRSILSEASPLLNLKKSAENKNSA